MKDNVDDLIALSMEHPPAVACDRLAAYVRRYAALAHERHGELANLHEKVRELEARLSKAPAVMARFCTRDGGVFEMQVPMPAPPVIRRPLRPNVSWTAGRGTETWAARMYRLRSGEPTYMPVYMEEADQ